MYFWFFIACCYLSTKFGYIAILMFFFIYKVIFAVGLIISQLWFTNYLSIINV